MSSPVTRRRALTASAVAALGFGAGIAAVQAAPTLSANDARLVAIADELQATFNATEVLSAAHPQADKLPEWDALIDRFTPLETEMADTPADSLAGVLAKARGSQVPCVETCVNGIADSIAVDLVRLHAAGRIAHA